MNGNRIEFYKRRTLNERFSAGAEFVRQNGRVLVRNLLIPALPMVVILGYFMQTYTSSVENIYYMGVEEAAGYALNMLGFLFFSTILSLFLYGMTGSIMWHYQNGTLTESSGWADLKGKMYSFASKTFGIYFVIGIIAMVLAFLFSILMGILFMALGISAMISFTVFLFMIIIIILLPPLWLVIYPAYFEDAGVWKSISKGFSLGLKSWGSCFLMSLVVGLVAFFISMIFMIPSEVVGALYEKDLNIVTYLLAVVASFGSVLVIPFIVIFMAFQYFAVVEREEGVSYKNTLDDFENL